MTEMRDNDTVIPTIIVTQIPVIKKAKDVFFVFFILPLSILYMVVPVICQLETIYPITEASGKNKCNKKGNKNPIEHAIMVVMTQTQGANHGTRRVYHKRTKHHRVSLEEKGQEKASMIGVSDSRFAGSA
jgi:hypothetical protein